ncbi:MAG: hypothetical protein RLZZ230_419 [Candidatus Parcubacteria bacterium]|jgi:hypothetical protein
MTAFDPEQITFFAKTDARGQDLAFGIKAKDRQRHMYVVGKTGMGKSTLLENMAAQDIMNGEGIAFIDPHGSAAETLLEYVPEHRVKDVVYFAPFDLDNPISFNIMEDVGADRRHLVVSGLMSTFKKIWVDAWSARMEYILTNALLALIEYPDTTLLSVSRLFADKEYRKNVVNFIKDPAVKAFWVDEYANYTERFTAEALPAIQNKIGQFTGNPLIRNIIGQPHSSFDIREMMDNKKILIMNLSKGLIGETNANLLGSMLTTRIYLAAMSRANLPVEEMKRMPNFYFYVDEFQSFANATFANILSEARKYHLNLIIAHQYIDQMEEEVRSAVFGNVGTTIAFRVGPFDSEVLETVFAPRFMATDLVNLGFAQIYLTLMIDGIGSQPFSAKTLPPVKRPVVSCREMVIDASRKTFTKPREIAEKIVSELLTPTKIEVVKKPFEKKPNGQPERVPSNYVPNSAPAQNRNQYQGQNSNQNQSQGQNQNFVPRTNDRRMPAQTQDRRQSQPNEPVVIKAEIVAAVLPSSAPTGKTPDDLRNILSRMTKDQTQKTEPKAVVESPKITPPSVADKPTTPVESGSDLRSALAQALAKVTPPTQIKLESEVKTKVLEPMVAAENKTPSTPAADNSNLLRRMSVESSSEKPPVRPIHNSLIKSTPRPQPIQQPRFTPPETKSQVRKVVIEHRQQQPLVVKPSAAEVPQSITPAQFDRGPRRTPAEDWSAPKLDAVKIKRMLRHDNDERSPFQ